MNRRRLLKLVPVLPAAAATLTVHSNGGPDVTADVLPLQLKAGDTLVLKCRGFVDHKKVAMIAQAFEDRFPGIRAMVLDDAMSLEGVLRG